MRFLKSLVTAVYLLIGVVVANSHHYFRRIHGVKAGVSAALAVLLWPLVLFGVNLRLK